MCLWYVRAREAFNQDIDEGNVISSGLNHSKHALICSGRLDSVAQELHQGLYLPSFPLKHFVLFPGSPGLEVLLPTRVQKKQEGKEVMPQQAVLGVPWSEKKVFPETPKRFPLCLSNHSEILWALQVTNKAGAKSFSKGDYSIPCCHSQLPYPPKKGRAWMRGGGVGLSEPDNTQSELYKVTMDLLTQGWELRSMKQDGGFRTNFVQSSRTSPNTQPFITSSLCKVAWKAPPSGHLHAYPGTHVPHPYSK